MPSPSTLYVIRDKSIHQLPVLEYQHVVRLQRPALDLLGTCVEFNKASMPPGLAMSLQEARRSLRRWRELVVRARMADLVEALEALSGEET